MRTNKSSFIKIVPMLHEQMAEDKEYDVEVKIHREKRSLDANAYLWVLVTKIADVLRANKEDVYFEMLKRYGQGGVVKIPNKQVKDFERAYKYHEKHEKLAPEEKAQYFRFWVGSSNYDTKEMSILIDGVVSEAKDLDIETEPPERIEEMVRMWGTK